MSEYNLEKQNYRGRAIANTIPKKQLKREAGNNTLTYQLVDNRSVFSTQERLNSLLSSASSSQQNLIQHAQESTLSEAEVDMPAVQMDLSLPTVLSLNKHANSFYNPKAQPLFEGLQSGEVKVSGNKIKHPGIRNAFPESLPQAIGALKAKEVHVEQSGDNYRVLAHMNPWILVISGKIKNVDNGPWNKGMPPGWIFVKKDDLRSNGVDVSSPLVGQSYPASGGSSYTVPSATYSSLPLPPSFHTLPPTQLPSLPDGYAYHGGPSSGQPWGAFRDPTTRPTSPTWSIHAEEDRGHLHYTSWMEDAGPSHSTTRTLSAFAQVHPKGSGYSGPRDYPMTSADYRDTTGGSWDRGHAVDHYDGTRTTTTAAWNYVPESPSFNRGARNKLVQDLRPFGSYAVRYDYSGPPARTTDGTMIPDTEHFSTWDSSGTQSYYEIPNKTYPTDRHLSAVTPFHRPAASWPSPPTF